MKKYIFRILRNSTFRNVFRAIDLCINQSPMALTWQKIKWQVKYRINIQSLTPDLTTQINHPRRAYLLESIGRMGAWGSLHEIGCGRGANLFYLAEKNPLVRLVGTDISKDAIKQARMDKAFYSKGNVSFDIASLDDLGVYSEERFDIFLLDSVVMYCNPKDLKIQIVKLLELTNIGIIILAWNDGIDLSNEPWRLDGDAWIIDFVRLLKDVSAVSIVLEKIPIEIWNDKRWSQFGYIIKLLKKS